MQQYDSEKAARVWQRVRSEETGQQELAGLPSMAALEQELAAYYRQLARQQQRFVPLAKACQRHSAILRGIGALAGDSCEPAPFTGQMPHQVLRVCYGKTLQLLRQYEALQTQSEYGCVFRTLADNKRAQACFLLETVGKG